MVLSPGQWRRGLTGANALVTGLLLVLVLFGLTELGARFRVRWDLSSDGNATLRPETEALLTELNDRAVAVEITAFSAQAKDAEAPVRDQLARDFLRELRLRSTNLKANFVDYDRDRVTAERLGVSEYGTWVVQAAGRRVDLGPRDLFRGRVRDGNLTFRGEGELVRALRELLADRERRLGVLSGHGEHELFDRGLGEWKVLAQLVEAEGWRFRPLNLLRDAPAGAPPAVPDDLDAVLVLGGRQPLGRSEEEALTAFLARGGSLLWLVDPGGTLPQFAQELGLALASGWVTDEARIYPFEDRPLLGLRRHPATELLLADGAAVVVSRGGGWSVAPRDRVEAAPLLSTSRQGWLERGEERPPVFDEAVDGVGPIDVAVAVQLAAGHPWSRRGTSRLVWVADVDLAADELLGEAPGNAGFLVNSLRWMLGAEERRGRVAPPRPVRRLVVTPQQVVQARALLVVILPLAVLLLGLGGVAWRRRGVA